MACFLFCSATPTLLIGVGLMTVDAGQLVSSKMIGFRESPVSKLGGLSGDGVLCCPIPATGAFWNWKSDLAAAGSTHGRFISKLVLIPTLEFVDGTQLFCSDLKNNGR